MTCRSLSSRRTTRRFRAKSTAAALGGSWLRVVLAAGLRPPPPSPFSPFIPVCSQRFDLARSDSSPSPPPLSPPPPSPPPSPPPPPPSPPPLRPPTPVRPLPHPKASHADERGGDCWLAWEANDLPKDAKGLTLKHGALRAEEMADFGAFFRRVGGRAPPAVPYFAHGAQFAAAHAARRSTPKETCQWILQLVEARREYPTSPTAGSDIVSEPSVTAKAGPAWVLGCLVHLFRRLDTGHRASRDNGRLHGCKPCGARGMCGLSVCPPLALALHTLRLHTSAWCNSFGYLSAVFGTHTHLDMCSIAPTRTPMLYPSWAPP